MSKIKVYYWDEMMEEQEKEPDAVVVEGGEKVTFAVEEKGDGFEFKTNLYDVIGASGATPSCKMIHTDDIMMAFEPEQKYENPDGSPITFDEDLLGKKRADSGVIPGPFATGVKNASFTSALSSNKAN